MLLHCTFRVPVCSNETHKTQLLAVHANICTDVVRAVGHDLVLVFADFHSICHCSVYESLSEVVKFTIAAAHNIDVVGESQVTYGPSTTWRWMCGGYESFPA